MGRDRLIGGITTRRQAFPAHRSEPLAGLGGHVEAAAVGPACMGFVDRAGR
jgi:hypothetical protein